MSASTAARTPTLAARKPDGFWLSHTRYRNYVLFAATGLALVAASLLLGLAVRALASGAAAWADFLALAGSPPVLLVSALVMVGVLYFALRFLAVGAKPLAVRIGPVPAMPELLILVLQAGGFVTLNGLIVLLLSGVVL